jgi:hypothetical protein
LFSWRNFVPLININIYNNSPDISVGIAMGYELDGWASILGRGKRFFSTPQRPDRL